jgi:protein-S-isoprenylcysteine O-methyltransferase Ste14
MCASDFEFRHRSWVFFLVFLLGFGCYAFQKVNAVEWLLNLLGLSGPVAGVSPLTPAGHLMFAVGAVSVGLAALIRTWGTAYLRTEVMRDSAVRTERLVADGPYRYVRNPLYLGSLMMAAGIGLMASPIGWLVLMAGFVFALRRLIGREEFFLVEKQGAAYRAYLERVPRLWPALWPRVPASGNRPRWTQAVAGEIAMWSIFAGSAMFAFTFDLKVFEVLVVGGFFLSRVIPRWMKRRSEQSKA